MKKKVLKTPAKTTKSTWKARREILSKPISLEVDLESRQLYFNKDSQTKLSFDFDTDDLDSLIKSYLNPKDSKAVIEKLSKAEKGLEKPIPFNFVHPLTAKQFHFEYRYKIVYVKYSSTRLQGELIQTKAKKITK